MKQDTDGMPEIVKPEMIEKVFRNDELDAIPDADWNQFIADSINADIKEALREQVQTACKEQRQNCLDAVDLLPMYSNGCPEDHMNAILNAPAPGEI